MNSSDLSTETDRYVTFCGIDCDGNADRLMATLEKHLAAGDGDPKWLTYFKQKQAQQHKLSHDNLYFVGAQVNTLYDYFEECEDSEALELLWQLEQECC